MCIYVSSSAHLDTQQLLSDEETMCIFVYAAQAAHAIASHAMQQAVVHGTWMLTAHGPVASLLQVRGQELAPLAPPTWLGKPAFFLAIAGVVLWNVYGRKRDTGYALFVYFVSVQKACQHKPGPTRSCCCSAWQQRAAKDPEERQRGWRRLWVVAD